jgi:hypothetical protein
MIAGRIPGATRYLGAPVGWAPESDGDCAHLAIRDMLINDAVPSMHSVWEPTPEELVRLNQGAQVYLIVVGTVHPPVAMSVGSAPNDAGVF